MLFYVRIYNPDWIEPFCFSSCSISLLVLRLVSALKEGKASFHFIFLYWFLIYGFFI